MNYDALDYGISYGKPIRAQLANLLGPGGRLTTGKICDFPLTHEKNMALFEALDADAEQERKKNTGTIAAKTRRKQKQSLPGGDALLKEGEEAEKCSRRAMFRCGSETGL